MLVIGEGVEWGQLGRKGFRARTPSYSWPGLRSLEYRIPQPRLAALHTIMASQNEMSSLRWLSIALSTSPGPGECARQSERSATMAAAETASSGLGTLRVTVTKNS